MLNEIELPACDREREREQNCGYRSRNNPFFFAVRIATVHLKARETDASP